MKFCCKQKYMQAQTLWGLLLYFRFCSKLYKLTLKTKRQTNQSITKLPFIAKNNNTFWYTSFQKFQTMTLLGNHPLCFALFGKNEHIIKICVSQKNLLTSCDHGHSEQQHNVQQLPAKLNCGQEAFYLKINLGYLWCVLCHCPFSVPVLE